MPESPPNLESGFPPSFSLKNLPSEVYY
jgi:hypothetical protein